MFSVLLYSFHEPREWFDCMSVALLPVALVGAALLLDAVEGVICLLMAAPFAVALPALGGALGYAIQARHWRPKQTAAMLSILILVVPDSIGVERAAALRPTTSNERSALEVN